MSGKADLGSFKGDVLRLKFLNLYPICNFDVANRIVFKMVQPFFFNKLYGHLE